MRIRSNTFLENAQSELGTRDLFLSDQIYVVCNGDGVLMEKSRAHPWD